MEKKDLIHYLAPFLCECQETVECKRVEMCLIWGIEPLHHLAIYDMVFDARRGLDSAYDLVCRVHDYLKARNYF